MALTLVKNGRAERHIFSTIEKFGRGVLGSVLAYAIGARFGSVTFLLNGEKGREQTTSKKVPTSFLQS